MSVGVMEDYKLRDLRASHTLGRPDFPFFPLCSFSFFEKNEKKKGGKN
jgi:hypothetical protein